MTKTSITKLPNDKTFSQQCNTRCQLERWTQSSIRFIFTSTQQGKTKFKPTLNALTSTYRSQPSLAASSKTNCPMTLHGNKHTKRTHNVKLCNLWSPIRRQSTPSTYRGSILSTERLCATLGSNLFKIDYATSNQSPIRQKKSSSSLCPKTYDITS